LKTGRRCWGLNDSQGLFSTDLHTGFIFWRPMARAIGSRTQNDGLERKEE